MTSFSSTAIIWSYPLLLAFVWRSKNFMASLNSIVSWPSFLIYSFFVFRCSKTVVGKVFRETARRVWKKPSERLYTPTENGTPEEEGHFEKLWTTINGLTENLNEWGSANTASAYKYKNFLSGVIMTVADAKTFSWKFSSRFWEKYDWVLPNSEVGQAFIRKQFISMDRPPLVIFTAKFQACFIFRQCVCPLQRTRSNS